MNELLQQLIGKRIDLSVGTTAVYRGEVLKVTNGVLHLLDDEEKNLYVSVDKIATVMECSEMHSRPGFVA